MKTLANKAKATMLKYNMIQKGDSIVVGISGGADSVCLLHLLKSISEEYAIKLYGVHLNHMFRGAEADADALYVEEFCKALNIPSFIRVFDVPAYARQKGLSSEEAGREVRYKLFYEILNKVGATKIAVAQNLNDHAETILMRFMRGTGAEGLTGIDAVRGEIIRPLIEVERREIEEYCSCNFLEPRLDKTNLEPIYSRNKVRLELLPYIQDNFNPNIMNSLVRLADILRDENDFLERLTQKEFEKLAQSRENEIVFNIEEISKLDPAIRKRLIRLGILRLAGSLTGYDYRNIENVLELRSRNTGAAVVLPRGLKAYVSYQNLILAKHIEKKDEKWYYNLITEGVNKIEQLNAIIQIHRIKKEDIAQNTFSSTNKQRALNSFNTVYIDEDKINDGLTFRNRREGDRFSPVGMKGSKKLKDYFIDEKVPKADRDSVELIADGSEIVWIIGKRLSEKYRLTNETRHVLQMNITKGEL